MSDDSHCRKHESFATLFLISRSKPAHLKLSIDLSYETPAEWADQAIANFDAFLQDHANCERKASAMAMSFIAKCPDKVEIIPELIETAQEELEHFKLVYDLMDKRKVQLRKDMDQDIYMKKLIDACRSSPEERLMDRMLIASIVECRGAERFKLVADALTDPELKQFYKTLWISEAKHGNLFVKMALLYWPENEVFPRLDELNTIEGQIISQMEWRPALH